MASVAPLPAELFLLLTDDRGRSLAPRGRREVLTAGALVELQLRGRVAPAGPGAVVRVDPSPTGDPFLDAVADRLVAEDGTDLLGLLRHRGLDLRVGLAAAWAGIGVLEQRRGLLGSSWRTTDPEPHRRLVERLHAALAVPGRASVQDGAELVLLRAIGASGAALGRDAVTPAAHDVLNRMIEGSPPLRANALPLVGPLWEVVRARNPSPGGTWS